MSRDLQERSATSHPMRTSISTRTVESLNPGARSSTSRALTRGPSFTSPTLSRTWPNASSEVCMKLIPSADIFAGSALFSTLSFAGCLIVI